MARSYEEIDADLDACLHELQEAKARADAALTTLTAVADAVGKRVAALREEAKAIVAERQS